jgi:hypothetical protein
VSRNYVSRNFLQLIYACTLLLLVDSVELEGLWEQYKSLASAEDGVDGIDKSGFEACLGPLGLEGNIIVDRTFQWFDQDNNKLINFREFVCGLSVLWKGTLTEKIDCEYLGVRVKRESSECRSFGLICLFS